MADEFSQSVLTKVVAQICQMVGFHKIMTPPLYILAELVKCFIRHLGQKAKHYAEHCGRSRTNLNDLSLAFFDSGLIPSELVEFLNIVNPLPQCLPIPMYPVIKKKVNVPCEESQALLVNQSNNIEERKSLKIKISLSKIKAASKTKRNKIMRKKKKIKRSKKV